MTTTSDRFKFAAAVLLFALWGWLVYIEHTPATELVEGIKYALIGLGVFHATQSQPPSPPAEPAAEPAPYVPPMLRGTLAPPAPPRPTSASEQPPTA